MSYFPRGTAPNRAVFSSGYRIYDINETEQKLSVEMLKIHPVAV